jgi:hypothetical protein
MKPPPRNADAAGKRGVGANQKAGTVLSIVQSRLVGGFVVRAKKFPYHGPGRVFRSKSWRDVSRLFQVRAAAEDFAEAHRRAYPDVDVAVFDVVGGA